MTASESTASARRRRQGNVAVLLLVTWPLALPFTAVLGVTESLAVVPSTVAAASCLLGGGLLLLGGRTRPQAWRVAILATASS